MSATETIVQALSLKDFTKKEYTYHNKNNVEALKAAKETFLAEYPHLSGSPVTTKILTHKKK